MNVKPYSAYKDSGVSWLGDIPNHWEVWKIAHGFEQIGSGSTPKSDNSFFYNGNIPWVTTSELRENIIFDTTQKITSEAVNSYSALKIYPKGSLVIAMYGATIGRLGILGINATFNQACCVFSNPTIFNIRFVYYWLWMRRPVLISLSNGGGQPNLSQDDLKKIKIPTPPISEQKQIANYLDKKTSHIDLLITKKKELLEKLAENRIALISNAVTKGIDSSAQMKDSGVSWIGEIPNHWNIKKIKYFAEILRGKFSHRPRNDPRFYGGDYPFLQTGDVANAKKFIKEFTQTLNEDGLNVSKKFPAGTLVMTISANIGDIAILDFDACFPDSIVGFVPRNDVNLNFLFYMLIAMRPQMLLFAVLNTQLNLNIERISDQFGIFPNLEEQKQIADYLDNQTNKIDNQINKIKKAIDLLQEYRLSLITHAVTGKIDVRDFNQVRIMKERSF